MKKQSDINENSVQLPGAEQLSMPLPTARPTADELAARMAANLSQLQEKLPLVNQLYASLQEDITFKGKDARKSLDAIFSEEAAWEIAFAYSSLYNLKRSQIRENPSQTERNRQRKFMRRLLDHFYTRLTAETAAGRSSTLYDMQFFYLVLQDTLADPSLQPRRKSGQSKRPTGESYDFLVNSAYVNITQGPVTNRASVLVSQAPYRRNVSAGNAGRTSITDGQMHMFFDGLENASPSAQMFYDVLCAVASRTGLDENNFVYLPIRHYMKMRDLRDEKSSREQAKKDLRQLATTSLEYEDNASANGYHYRWNMVNLSGGEQGIQNSTIYFQFSDRIAQYMKKSGQAALPTSIFKIRLKTRPNAYAFGRKIALHYRMNAQKPNATIISVESLLACAPNLPSYEEVRSTNRKVGERIIKPFEDNMDELTRVGFIRWEYVGVAGATADHPSTYDDFIHLNIRFYIIEPVPGVKATPALP